MTAILLIATNGLFGTQWVVVFTLRNCDNITNSYVAHHRQNQIAVGFRKDRTVSTSPRQGFSVSKVLRAPHARDENVFTSYLSCGAGRQLSPEEYNALGSARETWCAVERQKEQDWCRATRKHYPTLHLKSEVLTASGLEKEPRCTWDVNKPTHKERRHYTSWSK